MTSVSNRNPYAEQLYKETEEAAASYPRDWSGLNKKAPDPWFAPKFQYYDSKVLNSHEYPNMFHIRPYELESVPATPSQAILESIEKNKRFFYGGVFLDVKRNDIWA